MISIMCLITVRNFKADWSYILFLLILSVVLKVWILKSKRWSWEERRSGYRSGEWRGSAVSLSLTQPTMSLPVSQKHMRSSRSAPGHKFQIRVFETQSNIFHVQLLRFNHQSLTNTVALRKLTERFEIMSQSISSVIKALQ